MSNPDRYQELRQRAQKALLLDGVNTMEVDACLLIELLQELDDADYDIAELEAEIEGLEEQLEAREDKAYEVDALKERADDLEDRLLDMSEKRDEYMNAYDELRAGIGRIVRSVEGNKEEVQ